MVEQTLGLFLLWMSLATIVLRFSVTLSAQVNLISIRTSTVFTTLSVVNHLWRVGLLSTSPFICDAMPLLLWEVSHSVYG